MGPEPVEELHVSLIYTTAAPHQHPWEAGGWWTDDVGKQVEHSRERQLEGERLIAKQEVTAQKNGWIKMADGSSAPRGNVVVTTASGPT